MKRWIKNGISIIIFLLLLTAILGALLPAYRALNDAMRRAEQEAVRFLGEKTGLGISYRSLSPSLLTGIRIKGIEIYDLETDELILTMRRANVSYRLKEILARDWQEAFSKLTVNDITFEFDRERYAPVIDKLSALSSSSGTAEQEGSGEARVLLSEQALEGTERILFMLPLDVRLNNCAVHYQGDGTEVTARIRAVDLKKQADGSAVSVTLGGSVLARFGEKLGGKSLGAEFTYDGKMVQGISGSSAILTLDRHPRADYSVQDAEFLVRYNDRQLVARSLQTSLPYQLLATVGLDSGDISAKLSATALDPFKVVRIPPLSGFMGKFTGTRVTTDATFTFNLFSKQYVWQADGGATLPRAISASGEWLDFSLAGDSGSVRFLPLRAHGALLEAELRGTFDIGSFQPSGVLYVDHYTLPTGARISGDIYLEPVGAESFLCVVPQLLVGEQAFTAVQLAVEPKWDAKSLDFSLMLSDYSHTEYEDPGELSVQGTFAYGGASSDVQAQVALSNFFLDSIVGAAAEAGGEELKQKLSGFLPHLEPFISSGEFYVSTDLTDITFNAPYLIVVNTREDRQALFLSMDGTQQSMQVSQLDVLYNKQSLQASARMDVSLPDRQLLFSTDCAVNGIPYQLSGVYAFGEWLNITGDYGFDLMVNFAYPLYGTFRLVNFPVPITPYLLSVSTGMGFSYLKEDGLEVTVETLEVEEISGTLPLSPHVMLSGHLEQGSAVIDSLSYSDAKSTLTGNGYTLWNLADGTLDTLTFNLNLANDLSEERIDIGGSVTNPLRRPLEKKYLMSDYFFLVEAALTAVPLEHVLSNQHPDDTVSGSITASGTAENPYVSMNIDSFSMQVSDKPLLMHGTVAFIEGNLTIPAFEASWNFIRLGDITGSFDVGTFSGEITSRLRAELGSSGISAPLSVSVQKSSSDDGALIPSDFTVRIDSDELTGSFFRKAVPFHFVVNRTKELISVVSDDYFGFSGEYEPAEGRFSAMVQKSKPFHFSLDGTLKKSVLDFQLEDLYLNLQHFASAFNSPLFSLYRGNLSGRIALQGLVSDPVFDGALHLRNLDFNLPDFIPEHLTTPELLLTLRRNEIEVPETNFAIKNSTVTMAAGVTLDRWSVGSAYLTLATRTGEIPVDAKVSMLSLKGRTGVDVSVGYEEGAVDVKGAVSLSNAQITLLENLKDLSLGSGKDSGSPSLELAMNVDVELLFGQKVNIAINPVLRGLVAPQTPVHVTMDSTNSLWSVEGDVVLRGGEVFYLNRNFYLKEGRVTLNETQDNFDPLLNLRAEIREHDDDGENVTITLSVPQQKLSQFSPVLSSSPAKSERELLSMLGQVLSGDSSNFGDILTSVGDFAAQSVFVRKFENALRDLCNFDIFSIRTTVLQNAIRQGLGSGSRNSNSVGNYFDNTTVYIGKYFGSSVYADALLRWSYDETMASNDGVMGGLLFQPELGLEFEAPFANIRWQFAPDLGALQQSWVPATSVTLSWRWSF